MKNILLIVVTGFFAFTGCRQKDAQTIENLKVSVMNESTASAKYAAFAVKAREEGHDSISRLFEAVSRAERIHAETFQGILDEKYDIKVEDFKLQFQVKTTAENIQAALDGESGEISTMYPQYLADAKTDKVEKAVNAFSWALEGEKKHLMFYKKALESLKSGTAVILPSGYAVCPVCGNTYDSLAIGNHCALCETAKEIFIGI